ncbi:hypothetical protein F4803DRAFT_550540 [Xylaria telfairii]|nr:hypothetical protein F4803DRAFT_550540 [Xylaria telfairii]
MIHPDLKDKLANGLEQFRNNLTKKTTMSSPIFRRPDTGCSATLSASLAPTQITHDEARCKCILAARHADEETIARIAMNVRYAIATGAVDSDKPAVAVARMLLGGEAIPH